LPVRFNIPAACKILENENNFILMLSARIDAVVYDGTAEKRGLRSVLVKINFAAQQFLSLAFVDVPPAAFPFVIRQLYEIIQRLNYMYIHFILPTAIMTYDDSNRFPWLFP